MSYDDFEPTYSWPRCSECGGKGGTHAARCELARAEFAGLRLLQLHFELLKASRSNRLNGQHNGCNWIICSHGDQLSERQVTPYKDPEKSRLEQLAPGRMAPGVIKPMPAGAKTREQPNASENE